MHTTVYDILCYITQINNKEIVQEQKQSAESYVVLWGGGGTTAT